MSKLTALPWVAAQKLPSKDLARGGLAFLERTLDQAETPTAAPDDAAKICAPQSALEQV